MFTKFDRGRLNSDGDRRGSLCGRVNFFFLIFDIIARCISVTVQDSPSLQLMTTRNQVWSNNGDIANDLQWPLTAPSAHFCKFWGFCPFYPTHFFRRLQTDIFEASRHDVALLDKRSAAIRISYKCPLSKMGAKTPKFRKGSAAMLLSHYISAAVRPISTKFDMITQFDPLDRSER